MADGKDGMVIGEAQAAAIYTDGAAGDRSEHGARSRVPLALSSDDLSQLTAALASYIERQNFAAARD